MVTEFRKSVRSILYERLTSPLSGAFFLTWIVWNWKILYLTVFVNEKLINGTKIDFIIQHYSNQFNLLWGPLLSTICIVGIYPFFSTGAFWINVKFNNWKVSIKNKEERTQLLTLEQSIQLREEIRSQEERFDRLLKKKSDEVEFLRRDVENYRNQLKSLNQNISDLPADSKSELFDKEYETLQNNPELFKEFQKIAPKAQRESTMFTENSTINRSLFDYFLANDYIVKSTPTIYKFTEKGKYLNKLLLDDKYIKKI